MKHLLLSLSILASLTGFAQNSNKTDIIGSWKVEAMEGEGDRFDFTNPEDFANSMYKADLRKEPGKVFTAEDSSAVAFASAFLYVLFKEMEFEFKKNGTFTMSMSAELGGKKKTEKSEGKYVVKKDSIELTESKKKETQTLKFTMPDKKTIILANFSKATEMNLVLQKN